MAPPALGAAASALVGVLRRRALTEAMGDPATILRLVPEEAVARRRVKGALQAAGLFFVIIALAGPQWGVELVGTQTTARHVVIALDLSLSMLAEDVKPSRLEKAKAELSLLLEQLRGNRVGIVAFAGEAAVFCPITLDVDAAKQILQTMRVDALPRPGTSIAKAIDMASSVLERYPGGKAIVLLTDGEDTWTARPGSSSPPTAGTAGIQLPDRHRHPGGRAHPAQGAGRRRDRLQKDRSGNTVVSRLGEKPSPRRP